MTAPVPRSEAGGAAAMVVASGLVDAGCAVTGYRESPLDEPDGSARAIAQLLLRHGVVAVRDLGSGIDAAQRFRVHAGDGVTVTGAGPVLVDGPPRSEGDRPIRTPEHLVRTLDALAAEQVGWVNIRAEDGGFLSDATRAARDRGLRVAARGQIALDAAGRGQVDLIQGISALSGYGAEGPVEALAGLAGADPRALAERLERACCGGAAVTTELVALRRAVFVKESLSAPYLDELVPVLPHVRHFLQMRRGGAYLAGKRALARYSGLAQPSLAVARSAEEGWSVLLEATAQAAGRGVTLLPASRAPQMAVVPGYGLKEEMAMLVFAGLSAGDVMTAATVSAADFLGLDRHLLDRVRLVGARHPVTPEEILDLRIHVVDTSADRLPLHPEAPGHA